MRLIRRITAAHLLVALIAITTSAVDTYRWVGMATDVAQVDTITIAGTWAAADTATVSIGQRSLTLTVGTDTSTDQVATAIKEMINGDTQTGTGDHLFSAIGSASGEWREVTATVASSVVTVTGDTAGKPFTLTATETTAGDGTATRAASVACTGKNFVDNANNWYNVTDSSYEVPANGGDAEAGILLIDSGTVSLLYALATLTDVSPANVHITSGFAGKIGLPRWNIDDTGYPYAEYRTRNLAIGAAADSQAITCIIGQGDGSGSSRINIDFGDCQYACLIYRTAARAETAVPPVLLQGTHVSSTLTVNRGDVGVSFYRGDTGHLATVDVGYMTTVSSDATVYIGSDCDVANAAITQGGGVLTLDSATGSGTVKILGGTCTILSGAHAALTVANGTCKYLSTGTITQLYGMASGTLDCRYNLESRTITDATLYKDAAIYDTFDTITWTNNIALKGCKISDITFDTGADTSGKF